MGDGAPEVESRWESTKRIWLGEGMLVAVAACSISFHVQRINTENHWWWRSTLSPWMAVLQRSSGDG
jgi:hypothetical protein